MTIPKEFSSHQKLKIGYVSPDFKRHPVGCFIAPIIKHHDRQKFEIYCYGEIRKVDEMTEEIKSSCDHWRSTLGLTDEQVIEQIKQDQIDILIDLAGHTEYNRLPIFFAKPAPIQASYLGYFATTGISTIDYWITDHHLHPLDTQEKTSETIWRLPRCYVAYQPSPEALEVNPLPALSSEYITFACLNNFSKLNPFLLSLWAKILQALPQSRLILKSHYHNLDDPEEKQSVELFLQEQGLNLEQVELIDSPTLAEDYFALYHRIDIHLDTFPYNGCTTTCDALWMGVPVLTLAGDRKIQRMGNSLLQAIGLEDWIAHTPEEYVNKAITFARNLEAIASLRTSLRERFQKSQLGDIEGLTLALENAYQQMWEKSNLKHNLLNPEDKTQRNIIVNKKSLDSLLQDAQQHFQNKNFDRALQLYKELIREIPDLQKDLSIHLAHCLILGAHWEEICAYLVPGINYLSTSGWLNSLFHAKPVNAENKPIPWYTYPAIEFLEDKIKPDSIVFEFGAGNSTLWWASKAKQVISIENDRGWFNQINQQMSANVRLNLETDEQKYVDFINQYPDRSFDVIIVDGINRNACLKNCLSKLKDNGLLIFDNTDDHLFDSSLKLLSYQGYKRIDFYGLIPSYTYKNCTSLFFKFTEILETQSLPSEKQSCLGKSCFQITAPRQNQEWVLTTPVTLMIFNRPDTTARVFEAIRQAKPPKLLVIADGPRSDRPDDVENCQAARAIVEQVDWDCEVLKNYSEVNLGCRKRVITGLNWVFEQVEEAIFLEDDCLPHPTFFRFCQELLDKYRNDPRIMMISGDNFQFGRNQTEYSYYFSRYGHIWGWATWKRSWSLFDESMPAWPELRDQKWLDRFLGNEQAATFWSRIFQGVYDGFNTWDYIWLFTLWCYDGLTILPNVNLVSNIGFGSGTHTTMKDSPLANMKTTAIVFPLLHPTVVERNIEADRFTESTQFSKADLSNSEKVKNQCKICGAQSYYFANAYFLQKYDVSYFQCSNCKFIQTEEPYWLEEAYSKAIASSDVGLVYRNSVMAEITSKLLFNFFDHNGSFLDYGGGYGLFVRLMRDKGFNFYWEDKYCQNLFAQEFEFNSAKHNKILLTTAFELFEHFVNPVQEIEKILKISPNILFSTQLLPENNPKPSEWWYFTPHEGQHISIFTKQSLAIIARRYNLNFYTDGSSLHLLTDQVFAEDIFQKILSGDISIPNKSSLLSSDYQKVVSSILGQASSNVSPQLEVICHPIILVDGVFFQMYSTGIARVWRSLLEEWSKTDFAKHILVLDRGGNTAPKIEGIRYRAIPLYEYDNTEADKQMLQEVCNQENADLFISTYYTTPLETPSIFMAYDMIPEVMVSLDTPMWREKHHAIQHACGYISISGNTADDLSRLFTGIDRESITVAHCGVASLFSPASQTEKDNFKFKYGIHKPYFLLGNNLLGYKNGILFFKAFQELANRHNFDLVCTGSGIQLPGEWRQYTSGCVVHNLYLTDDELRIAYSAAIALVYPSKYEGFGMPIIEAMACGCPVITTRNASIPEVAGNAALYVGDDDIEGMADALYEVQKPRVRRSLIQRGLIQAQKFSWNKMASIVREKLLGHLANAPITVIENLNNLSSNHPTLNYYAQYVQKLCPQVNPQTVTKLLRFDYSCNWEQPSRLEDYNNIAVICLIEAEETQDLSVRKQLLNNAVTVLEKGKDYPLCAAHLALIYNLIGEYRQGYDLANAVLTDLKKSPIKDSFTKGLIYLPPTSHSLFRQQGNLERLLAAENADEQVFQLCIEALCQSCLAFYSDAGYYALTLASEKLINFPILDWLKGIVKIHCQQPDGILFLEQAEKSIPNSPPSIQALYLAYRNLPEAKAAEYWLQQGVTHFNPNSPDVGEWLWTQVKPENPFTYVLYDNLILTVEANLKSITTAVLLAQGDWFEAEMELWRTQIRPDMTVIDVGASVGVYTFSAAQRVGETGKVIAIEPFKACVNCLQETSRINQLPWVKIYEAAASDHCGSAKLSLHNASELNEVISDNSPSSDSANTVTIQCLTLDSLIETENLTRVDWLKIDAEGHEIQVLQGAERLLTEFKPNIIYENIAGAHGSNGAIMEYIQAKGYQVYSYRPYIQELVPVTDANQLNSQLNLIAVYNPNK